MGDRAVESYSQVEVGRSFAPTRLRSHTNSLAQGYDSVPTTRRPSGACSHILTNPATFVRAKGTKYACVRRLVRFLTTVSRKTSASQSRSITADHCLLRVKHSQLKATCLHYRIRFPSPHSLATHSLATLNFGQGRSELKPTVVSLFPFQVLATPEPSIKTNNDKGIRTRE